MNVGLRPAIVAAGSVAWLWTAFASGLHAQQPAGNMRPVPVRGTRGKGAIITGLFLQRVPGDI
jgi:hypothetical protein